VNKHKKTKGSKKLKPDNRPDNREESPCDNTKDIISQAKDIATPLIMAEGMELVYIEYQHEPGGTVLRLYIDKPGGVSLDNCVLISRQLGDLLDINLEQSISYRLEVSSPGANRPLIKKQDFQRFKGQIAKIKVSRPVDGQKNFKGVLMGIDKEIVELMEDDRKIAIPYQEITKARLVDYNGDNRCL
jgi:ribosome maturation factor RimP